MNLSTTLLIPAVAALTASVSLAQSTTTHNDLPRKVWECQEANGSGTVLDGAKHLSIEKDQFGQLTMTLIQKDQFQGDSAIVFGLPLRETACQGFIPCESYESAATSADPSATLFINLLPKASGSLFIRVENQELNMEFFCEKK